MWPPSGKQIVNFPTWLHVANWGAAAASASAGPVTSTVTATPTSVTFSAPNSTDGGASYQTVSVTCQGAGPVYDFSVPDSAQHSGCTLRWSWPSVNYREGGTYPLSVTVSYAVTWTVTGASGGGSLGTVTATTTVPVTVDEIEAIGVPNS